MRIIVNVIRMITIKRKVNFVIKKKSIGDITTLTIIIMHIQMKTIIMLKKRITLEVLVSYLELQMKRIIMRVLKKQKVI
jgi:hypothetical protein